MNIQTLWHQLGTIPSSDFKAVGGFLLAGAVISVLVEVLRHFKGLTSLTRDAEAHTAGISRALVTGLSYLTAASSYIINGGAGSLGLVVSHTAILLSAAHVVYWVATQPLYNKFVGLLKDAENYRQINTAQPTSVAEPAVPPAVN